MIFAMSTSVLTERGHAVQVYKRDKSVSSNFYAQTGRILACLHGRYRLLSCHPKRGKCQYWQFDLHLFLDFDQMFTCITFFLSCLPFWYYTCSIKIWILHLLQG